MKVASILKGLIIFSAMMTALEAGAENSVGDLSSKKFNSMIDRSGSERQQLESELKGLFETAVQNNPESQDVVEFLELELESVSVAHQDLDEELSSEFEPAPFVAASRDESSSFNENSNRVPNSVGNKKIVVIDLEKEKASAPTDNKMGVWKKVKNLLDI